MAKKLIDDQFTKDFEALSLEEQEKIISQLKKKQKKEPKRPSTSSHENRKANPAAGSWD